MFWPSNVYTKCAKPEAVARRYPVKEVFLKILQNSQENTCPRPSLEILLKRDFNTDVFLWTSASRDPTPTCKSLVDVWTWGKVQLAYFGLYVTVALLSQEQCYRKYMEKKIHESDEHAFFIFILFYIFFFFWQQCFYNTYKLVFFINSNLINTTW